MAAVEVECGVLTETKITNDIHTQFSSGYTVFALNTAGVWQGRIAFFWRDNDLYEIKESKFCVPNVLSFELVTGKACFYVMGAYLPPLDPSTVLMNIEQAWKECLNGCKPILLGNLNINILISHDKRQDVVTDMCNSVESSSMANQFQQRYQHGSWGSGLTWQMKRGEGFVSSL
jgi:hypothetical protein